MKQKEREEERRVGEKKRRGIFFKRAQKKSGQELREYEECL